MAFFKKTSSCACNDASAKTAPACCAGTQNSTHHIQVLGSGCATCHALYENTLAAVQAAGLDAQVEYITDLQKIMEYGVMRLPALAVNGRVVSMGKLLKPADIEKLL